VIGVQTPGNMAYFGSWMQKRGNRLDVLQNWLGAPADAPSTIVVGETALAGRKVFVYAGNMGVAQGMGILLDVAERLRGRDDVGFLFVGRGSDAQRLRDDARAGWTTWCSATRSIRTRSRTCMRSATSAWSRSTRVTARTTFRASSSPTCRAACRCWRV